MTAITVRVHLAHISGPEQDEDTLLDFFAGTIGRANGAANGTLALTITSWDEESSVYEVALVEDA